MKVFHLIIALLFVSVCASAQNYQPADPQATPEAKQLFARLMELQKKGVMYGHQDDLMYGYSWWHETDRSDIKDITGDYPAVAGFELGHIELGDKRSLDSVSFAQITEQVKVFHKRNGVITISWHADNPLTGKTAWDVSSEDKAVKSILPGGENHVKFNLWLTRLADYFLTWKDDNGKLIPFLFRPWHEHSGSFFWWGNTRCTDEEYAQLWRYTVDFLKKKGLHNILYVYNTDRVTTLEQYLAGYPGDDVIDMLGLDMYDRGLEYFGELDSAIAFVSYGAQAKNKLCALSECGGRDKVWFSKYMLDVLKKYRVSYLLTWRNTYQPNPALRRTTSVASNNEDFIKFYNDPHSLFLRDIQ
jgi:mannan endo-1,4-beta-mannosidase